MSKLTLQVAVLFFGLSAGSILGIGPGIGMGAAYASESGSDLPTVHINLGDTNGLQNGAKLFVNYCLSCHSAAYMRYSRLSQDLGIEEDLVASNLMFTSDKIGDTMQVAMKGSDAAAWFGIAPPDLSVIARSRGANWLYSFLTTFYVDESKPTGVNNLQFTDTAMPHVLWELQGLQRPITETETDAHGEAHEKIVGLEPITEGLMSAADYREAVRDLVTFLVYMGEPAKLVRHKMGAWVISFLLVFLICAYLLKREYWKDVH